MQGKKKVSDNFKAGIFRWWMAGMCYFFIGFGTFAGEGTDPLDLIAFLGLALGLATVFIYNPIVYRMFDIVRKGKITNKSYLQRTGWQNAFLNLAEILKNTVLVFLVYMSYQCVNLLLEQLLQLPEGTITIPGEPIGFATLYILFYYLLMGLLDTVRERNQKDRSEI